MSSITSHWFVLLLICALKESSCLRQPGPCPKISVTNAIQVNSVTDLNLRILAIVPISEQPSYIFSPIVIEDNCYTFQIVNESIVIRNIVLENDYCDKRIAQPEKQLNHQLLTNTEKSPDSKNSLKCGELHEKILIYSFADCFILYSCTEYNNMVDKKMAHSTGLIIASVQSIFTFDYYFNITADKIRDTLANMVLPKELIDEVKIIYQSKSICADKRECPVAVCLVKEETQLEAAFVIVIILGFVFVINIVVTWAGWAREE